MSERDSKLLAFNVLYYELLMSVYKYGDGMATA